MSHYVVLVASEYPNDYEEMLRNYSENIEFVDEDYIESVDCTDEAIDAFNNGDITKYKLLSTGEMVDAYSKELYSSDGYDPNTLAEKVSVPLSSVYTNYNDVATEYYGYVELEEPGRYGYYTNPQGYWDWYVVGGRWDNLLKLKDGTCANSAQVKDIDFSFDENEYQDALSTWNNFVENDENTNFRFIWSKDYYIDRYENAEKYAKSCGSFSFHTIITPDGGWHERAAMCAFGLEDDEFAEENVADWSINFYDRFIKDLDPEYYLTVIDCHI